MGKDTREEQDRRGSRRGNRKPKGYANWLDATPAAIVRAIDAAAAVGGALRFGYSRDGGAFAIGVYGDGEPYTDFVSGTENIDDALDYYVELFSMPVKSTENVDKTSRGATDTRKKPM